MKCPSPYGRDTVLAFEYPEGSTDYLAMLGTTSNGGDINPTLVDVTDFSDGGHKRECPVEMQMSFTVEVNLLPDDPIYNLIVENLINLQGNKFMAWKPADGKVISSAYNVTSFSWAADKNEVVKVSVGLNSSGLISRAPVA